MIKTYEKLDIFINKKNIEFFKNIYAFLGLKSFLNNLIF